VFGDETVRAREIVYLVDDDGEELADGSALDVVGMPEDGEDDAVDLTIRTDGLRLEEKPGDVELEMEFEGRSIEIEKRLERQVADGVWELDYRLPLERDHDRNERVDLELVGNLPDGNKSRWRYRNLLLGSCRARAQGDFSGTVTGGGYNRREGRDDNWHSGTATVHIEMVQWDDSASSRANRRGWGCGRVQASVTAIAHPPPGAYEPVYTPYTLELAFAAEITQAAGR